MNEIKILFFCMFYVVKEHRKINRAELVFVTGIALVKSSFFFNFFFFSIEFIFLIILFDLLFSKIVINYLVN